MMKMSERSARRRGFQPLHVDSDELMTLSKRAENEKREKEPKKYTTIARIHRWNESSLL